MIDIDQVANNGRRGWHRPRASAVEESVSHRVADDANRIVRTADFRERPAALHQRRRHPKLEPCRRELRQSQQLDRVAELAGVLEVGEVQRVDPLPGNLVGLDIGLECELRQDRQFVRGVGAVDVHGRVGLGVAKLLGLAQMRRRRIRPSLVMVVRMKLQVPLTIAARLWTWLAASAKPSAWTMGIPPPTLPSKATARRDSRAWAKILGPCSARSALLAVTTCFPAARAASTKVSAGSIPPMVSMNDFDFGIVDELAGVGGDSDAVERDGSRLGRVSHRSPFPADAPARSAADAFGVLGQSRATPVPTVPRPIKPIVTSFIGLRFVALTFETWCLGDWRLVFAL